MHLRGGPWFLGVRISVVAEYALLALQRERRQGAFFGGTEVSGFGLPSEKHFFEHYHRFMVVIAASLIYVTAAYAARNVRPARKTAIITAILVSVQIVLGMLVVNTKLEPLLVAAHLSTGILLFAMALLTFLESYRLARKRRESSTL